MLWDFFGWKLQSPWWLQPRGNVSVRTGGERNGEYLRCVLFNHICPSDDCGAFPNNKFLEAPFLLVMIDVIHLGPGWWFQCFF